MNIEGSGATESGLVISKVWKQNDKNWEWWEQHGGGKKIHSDCDVLHSEKSECCF